MPATGAVYEPSSDSELPLVVVIFDEAGKLVEAVAVPTSAEGKVLVDILLANKNGPVQPER